MSLLFGDANSRGSRGLIKDCAKLGREFFHVQPGVTRPGDVVAFLRRTGAKVIHCAGNRESAAPGVCVRVERFLTAVFRVTQADQSDPVAKSAAQ